MTNGVRIETFGCRLNSWESEVIREHTNQSGWDNMVVINTCAVTAEAEKQARQMIRKTRREDADIRIIVTGCAAQINPEAWQNMPEVDAVIGNHEKLDAESWRKLATTNAPELPSLVGDIMTVRSVAPHMLAGFDHHSRAFLQIQQGCDHRCTFCIIPYGRGGSRSVSVAEVVAQTRHLVDAGVAEIVLTGVDISSWGNDLGRSGQDTPKLGQLVAAILAAVPELPRLRLSSIDPADVDVELRAVLADHPRLMPHLHLSVQHGDGLMLKRMKRRHSPDDLIALVDDLRQRRPDIVFGADIIAGFPTEDEHAHNNSMRLMDDLNISWLHVFPFSPREGTPAARMPQTDTHIIRTRARQFRKLGQILAHRQMDKMIGQNDEVVMESGGIAHTRQFGRVQMATAGLAAGQVYPVRILRRDGELLEAELRS
ncbi:MAG: tRNA (N(6)-L-threonylcarbamoyladenosine(37)-C(2))-methylthiotransferase MtaB [Candidatus Puniceispirillales bacterium]